MPFLTKDEVLAEIDVRLQATTVRRLAHEIGITRGHLYGVLRGKREPGPAILSYLNLEQETTKTTVYRAAPKATAKELV